MQQAIPPFLFLIILLTSGCQDAAPTIPANQSAIGSSNGKVLEVHNNQTPKMGSSNSKTHNEITYSFQLMSALDFVTKKGEKVAASDTADLKKEVVMIATFQHAKSQKDILDSDQITLDKEAATQYLVGELASDVTLEQAGKKVSPTGVHYEKSVGQIGQVRAFLFFEDVSATQLSTIIYYDRLFGAGLMRFTVNK
ncbi:MAG: hypothetical protein QE487_07200 [Fluviicola sp.]|nr:hypothetical protein [Fluviicola sp.]